MKVQSYTSNGFWKSTYINLKHKKLTFRDEEEKYFPVNPCEFVRPVTSIQPFLQKIYLALNRKLLLFAEQVTLSLTESHAKGNSCATCKPWGSKRIR